MPVTAARQNFWEELLCGGGRGQRALLTGTTTALLIGLYVAYSFAVTPLVTPVAKQREHVPTPVNSPRLETAAEQMAKQHLARYRWPATAPYKWHTEESFIYFCKHGHPDERNGVRLEQFALVWFQHGRGEGEEPVTIVSDTAYVRFLNPLKIDGKDPGRVVEAILGGSVEIIGPKGLHIRGTTFHYTEESKKIWSDEAVDIAYGPHRASADHGMQLDLILDEPPIEDKKIALAGVSSVRMRQKVRLDLVAEPSEEGPLSNAKQSTPVTVECNGSFDFFMQTNTAMFQRQVHVTSPSEKDPSAFQRLFCDFLTLVFEPKAEATVPNTAVAVQEQGQPAGGSEAFQGPESNLELHRLRAQGTPTTPVVLISEFDSLEARMTDLIYDAESRVALLSVQSGQAEAGDKMKQVEVNHDATAIRAPEITLAHAEDGTVNTVWCKGAGWLRHLNKDTNKIDFTARWERQSQTYPDEQTGDTVIELEERAVVRQPDASMALAADFIRVWAESTTKEADEPAAAAAGSSSAGRGDATAAAGRRFKPKRLLAEGNVDANGTGMQCKTQQFEVVFRDGEIIAKDKPKAEQKPDAGSQTPETQSDGIATAESPDTAGPPRVEDEKKDERGPIHVQAQAVRVDAIQGPAGTEPQATDIRAAGSVAVVQQLRTGEDPVEIKGDQLHVENRGEGAEILHVTGQPASVHSSQMHIAGEQVHLDRGTNEASVDGAGLLQIPVTRSMDGKPLAAPMLLDVWWKQRMTFDGQTAHFVEKVVAVLDRSRVLCDDMIVTLTDHVDFNAPDDARDGDDRPKVDVNEIRARGDVDFESQEFKEGKLVAEHRGAFREFRFSQVTGATEAMGPGVLKSWTFGSRSRSSLGAQTAARANAPLAREDDEGWEYTQVDFSGRMLGNSNERHTTFHDDVVVLRGPVERNGSLIDGDNLGPDHVRMTCQALRVTQLQAEAAEPTYELYATGNARLKGKSDDGRVFSGQSDEITYDGSKSQFQLRSHGRFVATLWMQKQIGSPLNSVPGKSIMFTPPATYQLSDATGLEGVQ